MKDSWPYCSLSQATQLAAYQCCQEEETHAFDTCVDGGFCLQQDKTLSPRVQIDLAMIRRNIVLERRLIDDLLDLTRITHNKLELLEVPLDLHSVLQNATDVCVSGIEGRNLDLSLNLAADHTGAIGDGVCRQQVFWNVIRHAIK